MSKETFYMVYLQGESTPAFKHTTLQSAEKEAKRLAELHRKKSYVLCTLKSFEMCKFIESDCRPDSDYLCEELPFK